MRDILRVGMVVFYKGKVGTVFSVSYGGRLAGVEFLDGGYVYDRYSRFYRWFQGRLLEQILEQGKYADLVELREDVEGVGVEEAARAWAGKMGWSREGVEGALGRLL